MRLPYMHEYGHYIQSQQSGPAYLLMFGVESLWAAWKDKLIYTEKDANYEAREYFMKHEGLKYWDDSGKYFPKDYLF